MKTLFNGEPTEDVDAWQAEEARQQAIIEAADAAADRIIMDGSDGTVEMTNYLTAQVALKMVTRALQPFGAAMVRKELTERHPTLAKACEFGPRFGSSPQGLPQPTPPEEKETIDTLPQEDIDTLDA